MNRWANRTDDESRPFAGPSSRDLSNENFPKEEVLKSATFVLFVITLVTGFLMAATAVYNVFLWQGDVVPSRDLSRSILTIEVLLMVGLGIFLFFNSVLAAVNLIKRQKRKAMLAIVAVLYSIVTVVFCMLYDQALIFYT